MIKQHRYFTSMFKREAVRLSYDSGFSMTQMVRDLAIGKSTLSKWRRQMHGGSEEKRISNPNEDELVRLRRENRTLRQERNVLKKATAFFAKEGSQ